MLRDGRHNDLHTKMRAALVNEQWSPTGATRLCDFRLRWRESSARWRTYGYAASLVHRIVIFVDFMHYKIRYTSNL